MDSASRQAIAWRSVAGMASDRLKAMVGDTKVVDLSSKSEARVWSA